MSANMVVMLCHHAAVVSHKQVQLLIEALKQQSSERAREAELRADAYKAAALTAEARYASCTQYTSFTACTNAVNMLRL
jgi:hypothetical protein